MSLVATHVVGAAALGLVYRRTLGGETSYVDSPLWLGIPFVRPIVVAQVMALAGLAAWVALVQSDPPTTGPLADPRVLYGASALFYGASALWPAAARALVARPSYARAAAAIAPLWVVAACVLVLAVGSRPPASLTLVPLVVVAVACDAVVWAAAAIFHAHRQTP
jgi:hypothetical protein